MGFSAHGSVQRQARRSDQIINFSSPNSEPSLDRKTEQATRINDNLSFGGLENPPGVDAPGLAIRIGTSPELDGLPQTFPPPPHHRHKFLAIMHRYRASAKNEEIYCNRRPHAAGDSGFRRSTIRDLGYRKSYGLSAVTVDPKLTELARKQANRDGRAGFNGSRCVCIIWLSMASYGAASAAENIAIGTRTFGGTLALWKSSSGHNANLLKRNVTRIGLASASGHGTRIGH